MNDRVSLQHATIVTLSICYQHLAARFNQALKPLDLNMTQLSILTHFSRRPNSDETVSSLAETMEMNQPAVTKAVQAMANHGWLKKQPDARDARIARVAITPAGYERLSLAHGACAPLVDRAFAALSLEELQQLLPLLDKIRQGLF